MKKFTYFSFSAFYWKSVIILVFWETNIWSKTQILSLRSVSINLKYFFPDMLSSSSKISRYTNKLGISLIYVFWYIQGVTRLCISMGISVRDTELVELCKNCAIWSLIICRLKTDYFQDYPKFLKSPSSSSHSQSCPLQDVGLS